uniref:3-deoxy-manno-octulosonate cytidylyltransferase n=1 Tax=Schlesneria paludicola TaxID=360056 RepID=A0A7C4QSF5_9PLAN
MPHYGLIPARLQSTRLPRKLLLAETGHPLLQYAWDAACRARSLASVLVATDSEEIAEAVRRFGGRVEMTGEHPSGTDRIAEVVRRSLPDAEIVVNVQGDEPELDPAHIDHLVALLEQRPAAEMATLATPMTTAEQVLAPSCVKVVCAEDGRALYFSRAPIPFSRDLSPAEVLRTAQPWLLHLGIYAYRREFLLELTRRPPSRLEQLEKLEQLRALEAGAQILVGIVAQHSVGIDTPDDYARFVRRQQAGAGRER